MKDLSGEEKQFLADLRSNSVWLSICDKWTEPDKPIPAYKPRQGNAREQELDWIFDSGVDRGHKNLIQRFRNG